MPRLLCLLLTAADVIRAVEAFTSFVAVWSLSLPCLPPYPGDTESIRSSA